MHPAFELYHTGDKHILLSIHVKSKFRVSLETTVWIFGPYQLFLDVFNSSTKPSRVTEFEAESFISILISIILPSFRHLNLVNQSWVIYLSFNIDYTAITSRRHRPEQFKFILEPQAELLMFTWTSIMLLAFLLEFMCAHWDIGWGGKLNQHPKPQSAFHIKSSWHIQS